MTSETKGMIDALRLKVEAYDNEINSIGAVRGKRNPL